MTRGCNIPDCTRPHWAQGWCRTHYMRCWRTGKVELQPRDRSAEIRPCADCQQPSIPRRWGVIPGYVRRDTHDLCRNCNRAAHLRRLPAGPTLTDQQRIAIALLLRQAPDLVDALGLNEAPPTVSLDTELAYYTQAARGRFGATT